MSEQYDSKYDTMAHIVQVQHNMRMFRYWLEKRAAVHDESKLEEPEKSLYDEWTPKLRAMTYGSDEYKTSIKQMGPALQHHYENNPHHPEHHQNGVAGMDLLDVIEMLCDWAAAVNRHDDGDLKKSIEINVERFGIEPQLASILENTRKVMGW